MSEQDELLLKPKENPYNPENSVLERIYYKIFEAGAKAQVAKLKAMGYEQVRVKCLNCKGKGIRLNMVETAECPTCKGTGKITNYVKWDREKVAEYLYNENEPTLIYDGVIYEK